MKGVKREFPPTPCYYMTNEGLKEFPEAQEIIVRNWPHYTINLTLAALCGPWGRVML